MKFARWTFIIAGVYGLIVIVPMLFAEYKMGIDYPPVINHPEYYYGFVFVTLAWQVLFFFIAINPVKYRLIILAAVLEKIPAGISFVVLFSQQRVSSLMFSGGIIDIIIGLMFIVSFFKAKESVVVDVETSAENNLNQQQKNKAH